MSQKYVDSFYSSITKVLGEFGITGITRGQTIEKEELIIESDVTAFVGIVGSARGNVAYSYSSDTAKKIASTMMMGMEVSSIDDMARSAISELSNMFTGNAMGLLSKGDYLLDITPPSVLDGEDIYFVLSTVKSYLCTVNTPFGIIDINIAMES